MPINLPNLDDRQFNDLIEEARALIPTYAPEWTNHNPSDPGVTLVELFAYLTEMLIYRLNRVTDDNIRAFLKLLNGPTWEPSGLTLEALSEDVRQTVLALRKRERAVTCEDFETLALEADARVARAHCVARRDLSMDPEAEREGHISVIIVPRLEKLFCVGDLKDSTSLAVKLRDASDPLSQFLQEQFSPETQQLLSEYDDESGPPSELLQDTLINELNELLQGPSSLYDETRFAHVTLSQETQQLIEQNPEGEDLIRLNRWLLEEAYPHEIAKSQNASILKAVDEYLDPRRLLTTFVHVVAPFYLAVSIETTIVPKPDERLPGEPGTGIQDRVVQALQKFLHPLEGGSVGKGWPFGRNVFVSEIYDLLDRLEGVDFVDFVKLSTADTERLIENDEGELVGIEVKPYELVDLPRTAADVTVQTV